MAVVSSHVIPALFPLLYLLTLSPTILWRDTPEFPNIAFTLSIAHPAGFPTYALIVKALTFIPAGNIAFRVNLASALFALITTVLLACAIRLFISRVYPFAPRSDVGIASVVTPLLFAFGPIVWHNAVVAEVYTLNALFLSGLMYLILRWLHDFDPRWLYLGAFLYGLSAGNHATVALFLPGLVAVYFMYRPIRNPREWLRAIFFFLLGLSVYLYLPIRSLANPSFDWGDPENLKNFLYQISDQKDFVSGDIYPSNDAGPPFGLLYNHLNLIVHQFSPVGAILIFFGLLQLWKYAQGLTLLFLWIVFSNHAFFWGWKSGDAFLPSYVALTFFVGIGTCVFLGSVHSYGRVTASRVRELVGIGLAGLIVVQLAFSYFKVNKRDYYLPFDFYRPAFISLEPDSVLFSGLQWFHLKYFQDVERLREDITVISLQEVLNPRAFHSLSRNRHPRIVIPAERQTDRNGTFFLSLLLDQNSDAGKPIYWELTPKLFDFINQNILPHHDFLFLFSTQPVKDVKQGRFVAYFERVWSKMLMAAEFGQAFSDHDLPAYFSLYLESFLLYLQAHDRPSEESLTLRRLHLLLHGPEGDNTLDGKQISNLYNSVGLSELHQGGILSGLKSLELAIRYDPKNMDPYLNLALWSLEKSPDRFGSVLQRARKNGLFPEKICATLMKYLLQEGATHLLTRSQLLCKETIKENR